MPDGCPFKVLHGLRVADSVDKIISIISLSLCRPDPVTSSTTPTGCHKPPAEHPGPPRWRASNEMSRIGSPGKDNGLTSVFDAVDFVADNPGLTLFHCHQQLHMDFGFMTLFYYA
jgi:hypothetical protein